MPNKVNLRRVLVVDDDEMVIRSVARLMHQARIKVLTALSGEAALDILTSHSIHVIVSDSLTPPVSGLDLFRKARGLFPPIATILLSGQSPHAHILQARREGILDVYIPKPWDNSELVAAVLAGLAKAGAPGPDAAAAGYRSSGSSV